MNCSIEKLSGLSYSEIFSKEIFEKMKQHDSFVLNVSTGEIEELPITLFQNLDGEEHKIIYATHHDKNNHLFYVVHDVVNLIFDADFLLLDYDSFIKKIAKR